MEKQLGTLYFAHIVSIHDRICINGEPISDTDFIRLADQVKAMEQRLLETHDQLSFGLLTLIALLYFKEQR